MLVKRTERGWAGHYICSGDCRFRRNTLLQYNDVKIVVSTVGLQEETGVRKGFEELAPGRYFETMAFYSKPDDARYHDADASRQVRFSSPWCISEIDADDKANDMHEVVVNEITTRLLTGKLQGRIASD